MLSLFEFCGDDTVPVSTPTLVSLADMINSDICKIVEILDDFICVSDAESVLSESET